LQVSSGVVVDLYNDSIEVQRALDLPDEFSAILQKKGQARFICSSKLSIKNAFASAHLALLLTALLWLYGSIGVCVTLTSQWNVVSARREHRQHNQSE
jgi:hypothetical protein